MKRAVQVLKFLPCIFAVLLLIAWPTSIRVWLGINSSDIMNGDSIWFRDSSVCLLFHWPPCCFEYPLALPITPDYDLQHIAGEFDFKTAPGGADGWLYLQCPIPFLLTCLLPLWLGPFIRYRFSLRHGLLWIATLAAELAFYCQVV